MISGFVWTNEDIRGCFWVLWDPLPLDPLQWFFPPLVALPAKAPGFPPLSSSCWPQVCLNGTWHLLRAGWMSGQGGAEAPVKWMNSMVLVLAPDEELLSGVPLRAIKRCHNYINRAWKWVIFLYIPFWRARPSQRPLVALGFTVLLIFQNYVETEAELVFHLKLQSRPGGIYHQFVN